MFEGLFDDKAIFRFVISCCIVIFCVAISGIFLLGVKVSLIFLPKVELMGLTINSL